MMVQNLLNIHSGLNDTNNNFLTNINNDAQNSLGNITLQEAMNYISWIGLEGTKEFIDDIQNNSVNNSKKNYIENAARSKYTKNCN